MFTLKNQQKQEKKESPNKPKEQLPIPISKMH